MKDGKAALLFITPALLVILGVILFPFFYNVVLSFSNMNLTHFKSWEVVGVEHFIKIFSDSVFLAILGKTLIWTAINLFFHVTIGVFLAVLLDMELPGRAIFRVILILPWAIPQYISALTWRGMFNYDFGEVNLIMKMVGVSPIAWLSDPYFAFSAAILTNIWLGFPFMMVIALGGLQSIPHELYEAAQIDGASPLSRFRFITVPLLRPVMVPAISLGMVWTFNNFNVIWLVSNGGEPSDTNHILVSYVYKAVFSFYRYGYAAALSLVIFFILLLLSAHYLKISRGTESVY